MHQNLAKWYVYFLRDPRDQSVFYVGKGTANRIDRHEIEAAKGVCSFKCNKINSIKSDGFEIIKEKIAYFWCETAAYDAETDIIDSIGLSNLTNMMRGGAGGFEKRVKKLAIKKSKEKRDYRTFMQIIEDAADRVATMIVYPNSYWVNANDSEVDKKIKFYMAKATYGVLPKLLKHGLNENKEKMIEIFKPYGVELWQLERAAA